MEPTGNPSPENERQMVPCNPAIAVETPPSITEHQTQPQQQTHAQFVRIPQCVKTTISQQLSGKFLPPTQLKNNVATLAVLTNSANNNSNGERNSALVSTTTVLNATTQAVAALSGSCLGHHHSQQHSHEEQPTGAAATALHKHQHHGGDSMLLCVSGITQQPQQQTIDKLSRPMAFDKMEVLVREMQDQEHGVPVRQQKMFLTSIPYAFMGYDLIEWLMDHLQIEESEALNIANQLCLHGYFFPVNDSKTLTVKDDSSLYRFQTPYYWPWQHKVPDNVEYAIYLTKRSLRNKQRHALEDYEAEAFASLHKNLKGKWDFISMQAEEQVRLAKERKKGDKIVGDSQERAYWRVHRPPPGLFTPLEPCPVPSRDRQGQKPSKRKTPDDIQREVEFLIKTLNRTRMKMSQACQSLVSYSETFNEYDFFLQPALPSNPWVTEDIAFWQLNSTYVDIPTEKRVKRWAISIEELISDPTGLQEFTTFLEKEYSHENIRFWIAVNRLRRSAHSQVERKVNEIYEEFLKPGAPCEINIDGKTMESVLRGLKNPSRFTFDSASEHIYMLLLKKDCYPRFVRSEHYKRLVDSGIQPSHKKRFFYFGAVSGAKKKMTAALSCQPNQGEMTKVTNNAVTASGSITHVPPSGGTPLRRGSDRSLTSSALELGAIAGNTNTGSQVPHSHSQDNLCEIPYRKSPKSRFAHLETSVDILLAEADSSVCPCDESTTNALQDPTALTPDKVDITVIPLSSCASGVNAKEVLIPHTSNACECQCGRASCSLTTTLPIVSLPPLKSLGSSFVSDSSSNVFVKDLHSIKGAEGEEELQQLPLSQHNNEPSALELPVLASSGYISTAPPTAKITTSGKECVQIVPEALENQHRNFTTMPVNQYHTPRIVGNASTVEAAIGRQLQPDLDIVKEVQIQLIKTNTYDSSNIQFVNKPTNKFQKAFVPLNKPYLCVKEDSRTGLTVETMSEAQIMVDCADAELSPTTDEYQEGMHFGDASKDAVFGIDIIRTERNFGYVAPAPTPTPSIAPLAVLEVDIVDDEPFDEPVVVRTLTPALSNDEAPRRRKKRNSRIKKFSSLDERDKVNEKPSGSARTATDKADQNTVCPWEDGDGNTNDGTFVKTYATLGYL
ncbi:uncharacterized protein LOC115765157 [Drosophila novamexicana]|uniref:uncharacterized protein LOC115765157 n=1 Tax=Drosophila novamexicana TaxID=47314 RepID=UPI0011E5EB49|nr:uncharacterized protein LOC115765157 [Drosophila novamexicana]